MSYLQRLQDDSQAPKVNSLAITHTTKHFRSHVLQSAAHFLAIHMQKRGKTEVSNLNIHVSIEEKISWFQISMHHSLGMHVLDTTTKLDQVPSYFIISQMSPNLQQIL